MASSACTRDTQRFWKSVDRCGNELRIIAKPTDHASMDREAIAMVGRVAIIIIVLELTLTMLVVNSMKDYLDSHECNLFMARSACRKQFPS